MSNIYNRAPPSRATASTLCQKCLQRGHYSYECKTKATDRPYVSRPSRSQQMRNPKLKPKLTEQKLDDLTRKDGVADEVLKRAEDERRQRDQSVDSSDSVETVSTNARGRSRSPSRSPVRGRNGGRRDSRRQEDLEAYDGRRSRARDRSLSAKSFSDSDRELQRRRRDQYSRGQRRATNDRLASQSRSVSIDRDRAQYRDRSLSADAPSKTKRRSASPGGVDRAPGHGRGPRRDRGEVEDRYGRGGRPGPAPRDRSLSPYSRRIALTQSMNL